MAKRTGAYKFEKRRKELEKKKKKEEKRARRLNKDPEEEPLANSELPPPADPGD